MSILKKNTEINKNPFIFTPITGKNSIKQVLRFYCVRFNPYAILFYFYFFGGRDIFILNLRFNNKPDLNRTSKWPDLGVELLFPLRKIAGNEHNF